MEKLVAGLYIFFDSYTPFDPREATFVVIEGLLFCLIAFLFYKGWTAWKTEQITIGNSRYGIETHTGTVAKRIASYYLFISVFLILYLINVYTININFSVDPFRLYRGTECLWKCER